MMTYAHERDVAVIIPARDEEDRIGPCLTALAGQFSARVTVILVVNNTVDRTSDIARETATYHGLNLRILERTLMTGQGVGTARRIGCDHALHAMPLLRYLLTTDADCIVAPDWIARTLAHLETVDAVCGKVDLIADEADVINGMDRHLATLEGTYKELVQKLYARHAPNSADIDGTHGEAAGASLAFSTKAYLAVGGFDPVICGEDRRIVRAFRKMGCNVRHVSDVSVQASCRLTGRAVGGMSEALKARIGSIDYLIDDALPPAEWLVKHTNRKTLGPWPPLVAARDRLNVRELPRHIEILENFRNSGGLMPAPIVPADAVPLSHFGMRLSDKGSAIVPAGPEFQARQVAEVKVPVTVQIKASVMPTSKGA